MHPKVDYRAIEDHYHGESVVLASGQDAICWTRSLLMHALQMGWVDRRLGSSP